MALLIEIPENTPDSNGDIVALYRDNSGANTDADIRVYINSTFNKMIPVATKLSWQSITVATFIQAPGYNVNIRTDIMERGSSDVITFDNQYIENYKEQNL